MRIGAILLAMLLGVIMAAAPARAERSFVELDEAAREAMVAQPEEAFELSKKIVALARTRARKSERGRILSTGLFLEAEALARDEPPGRGEAENQRSRGHGREARRGAQLCMAKS